MRIQALPPPPYDTPAMEGGFFTRAWIAFLQALTRAVDFLLGGSIVTMLDQSEIAAKSEDLTDDEAGLLVRIGAPYNHLLIWNGGAWEFADGDHSGRFERFSDDPGPGWARCDGSTVTRLLGDGSTEEVTLPDAPDGVLSPQGGAASFEIDGASFEADGGGTGEGPTAQNWYRL